MPGPQDRASSSRANPCLNGALFEPIPPALHAVSGPLLAYRGGPKETELAKTSETVKSAFRLPKLDRHARRTATYHEEPGYSAESRLWLYGNVKLLHAALAFVAEAQGPPHHFPAQLVSIEREAERLVLDGKVLVCAVHSPAHQRAAVVPLRWGSPRIVVLPGGFHYHLGRDLGQEPFRAARLWRYAWDPEADLAVSRRAPDKLPTYAKNNPSVDRLVEAIAQGRWPGLSSPRDLLTPCQSGHG